jgi:DNA-binding response OmpR family regulator
VVASSVALLEEGCGYYSELVSGTVHTHVEELRRKLQDDAACPRQIITVRKSGHRLEA